MEKQTISFMSTDSIHALKGALYIPDSEPKGIFHHVHGMCDHKERYDYFLSEMCAQGYICLAYDNLGHGETARDESELGYFAEKDGYKYLAEDLFSVTEEMKKKYPDLPYYLSGHSLGSFIVRLAAAKHPKIADKLILMGTAGPNPGFGAALASTNLLKLIYGEKHFSPALEKTASKICDKRFGEGVEGDWLSKNPEVRREFDADKRCNFHFTASGFSDVIKINSAVNSKKWFKSIDKFLPILLLSGADDPIGDYGRGVLAVYKKLCQNGANAKLKLYKNNRHELLNDTARDDVISDILIFINKN